ncbi:MAG TPA: hypothetical protein VJ179_03060 [Patescibacteria group bacterium]|nr:hypothetical protein [Patescibacteria group bacterium]
MTKSKKSVFLVLLIFFSLLLGFLPLVVVTQDALTRLVEKNVFYLWIEKNIVPLEAKMMGVVLLRMGYDFAYAPLTQTLFVNDLPMKITWNCLGWQSMLFLLLTFGVGFGRKYRFFSVMEAVGIGLLGTLLINIGRMLLTVFLATSLPVVFRIVFHDYLAAVMTIVWLFVYWWFAYSYVLEEKHR